MHLALVIFLSTSVGADAEFYQPVDVEFLSFNAHQGKSKSESQRKLNLAEDFTSEKKVLTATTSRPDLNKMTDAAADSSLGTHESVDGTTITNLHSLSGSGDHVFNYLVDLIYKNRIYPYECIRLKQQGQVAVSFYIDEHGEVAEVKLLESSGFKQLDSAALKTLRKLRIDKNISQIEKLLSRRYSFVFDFEITKSSS